MLVSLVGPSDSLKPKCVCVMWSPRQQDNWSNYHDKVSCWYPACQPACRWATWGMHTAAVFSGNPKCISSMGSAHSHKGFVGFFFPLHRAQCLFPSKSFFALGTPRRLMADRAAADLVLSLHLNKHSCPDWQKPRLCFQPCLHRQGRYCYRADADAISQMCSKRK